MENPDHCVGVFYFSRMRFEVTILGCSSAVPTRDRFPTAQLVNFYDRYYLLDCGEGTQIQLRRYHLSMQRISHIFISHIHADHFLGLPGLLSTMDMLGRQTELHIHAPEGVIGFLEAYKKHAETGFSFPVIYHPIAPGEPQLLLNADMLEVHAVPLRHSVPCMGFIFREKNRKRNLRKDALKKYLLPVEDIVRIKAGEDYIAADGTVIPNAELTIAPKKARTYAFCTDTAFHEPLIPHIQGADLLYHEATFAAKEHKRAKATLHSTATDAARMAAAAGVQKLVLGHYSVRYENPDVLLQEALPVFAPTELAAEGKTFVVGE